MVKQNNFAYKVCKECMMWFFNHIMVEKGVILSCSKSTGCSTVRKCVGQILNGYNKL
jgi:hypothetical protein